MKRQHFEWLWQHCSPHGVGFVLDPVDQGVEQETRDDWISKGILHEEHEVEVEIKEENPIGLLQIGWAEPRTALFRRYVAIPPYESVIYQMFGGHRSIPDHDKVADNVELRRKAFKIDRERLAVTVAGFWGITPLYWEIPPRGYLFGYKDGEHHVIVLSSKIDRLLLPTIAIDTRENLGLAAEMKKSQKTYVVEAGSTALKYMELQRLYELNIVFAGTQDFLTEDGRVVWEFEYMEEADVETHPVDLFSRDPTTGRLMYDGNLFHLTLSEEIIFWQFQRRFGMAVNKDELRQMVWSERGKKEPEYLDENLRNHIFAIKRKLEEQTPLTIESTGLGNYRMILRDQQDK